MVASLASRIQHVYISPRTAINTTNKKITTQIGIAVYVRKPLVSSGEKLSANRKQLKQFIHEIHCYVQSITEPIYIINALVYFATLLIVLTIVKWHLPSVNVRRMKSVIAQLHTNNCNRNSLLLISTTMHA